jgi:hypothetical protein
MLYFSITGHSDLQSICVCYPRELLFHPNTPYKIYRSKQPEQCTSPDTLSYVSWECGFLLKVVVKDLLQMLSCPLPDRGQ